ncbi:MULTISPECIES: NUDIX hydrolase [unclassified Streptomyces]|uniref:NUDIX hydrolase n=1 Tax=unclassified Streptomyces TaxID=2593676 RepID=UPI001F26B824|nr:MULTISPECIES: NUDIX domain-containing protein [unclassified Streptomyces]
MTVVEPKEPKEPKRPTVSCVFVCHDGAGRVLLARRSAGARDEPGAWDCGAGALEFGESFERAVAREVYEEYGVRPLGIEQIGVRNVLRGDPVDSHWVAVVFAVRVERDEVTIGEPHKFDALDWFAPHALPVPLHSQCGATLELFEAGGGARERWPGRRQG